jgi:hypothetical protein
MKKLYPYNEHMDYYATAIGWVYLGQDGSKDYYVNHESQWVSIVSSNEPWDYYSGCYSQISQQVANLSYPINVLIGFIQEDLSKSLTLDIDGEVITFTLF